jgi:hypothetical protein
VTARGKVERATAKGFGLRITEGPTVPVQATPQPAGTAKGGVTPATKGSGPPAPAHVPLVGRADIPGSGRAANDNAVPPREAQSGQVAQTGTGGWVRVDTESPAQSNAPQRDATVAAANRPSAKRPPLKSSASASNPSTSPGATQAAVTTKGSKAATMPKSAVGEPEPTLQSATWAPPPITGNEQADKFEQGQRVTGKRSLYVWTGASTTMGTAEHVEFDDYRRADSTLIDAKARTGKAGSIYDVRTPDKPDKPDFRREIVRAKCWKQEVARQRSGAKRVAWIVQDPVIAQGLREFFAAEGFTTFSVEAPR